MSDVVFEWTSTNVQSRFFGCFISIDFCGGLMHLLDGSPASVNRLYFIGPAKILKVDVARGPDLEL